MATHKVELVSILADPPDAPANVSVNFAVTTAGGISFGRRVALTFAEVGGLSAQAVIDLAWGRVKAATLAQADGLDVGRSMWGVRYTADAAVNGGILVPIP